MCDRHTEPSREPVWQVALEPFRGTRGQRRHDDLIDGPAIENITDREYRVLVPDLTGRVDSLLPKALQGLRKCHARMRDRLPFCPQRTSVGVSCRHQNMKLIFAPRFT